MEEIFKLIGQYGLPIVLVVLGSVGLWKLLNRLLDENFKRDERIAGIMDGSLKAVAINTQAVATLLAAHDQRMEESLKSMREADRFQREEHVKMIELMNEILLRLERCSLTKVQH